MKRVLRALGRALEQTGAFVAAAFPWIILGAMITGIGFFVASDIKLPAWAVFLCFMVGGIFGLLIASMCAASGQADEHIRYRKLSPETGQKIEKALEEESLGVGA